MADPALLQRYVGLETNSTGQFHPSADTNESRKDFTNLQDLGQEQSRLRPNYGGGHGFVVTSIVTKDVYTTITNVLYNTIPVTLTQFSKVTKTLPVEKVSKIKFC